MGQGNGDVTVIRKRETFLAELKKIFDFQLMPFNFQNEFIILFYFFFSNERNPFGNNPVVVEGEKEKFEEKSLVIN